MAKWPYTGPWKRIRLEILERDGYRCRIVGPNCTGHADQVDHIVPLEQGGAPYDHANLRAACRRCNVGRANRVRDKEGWRTAAARITLVYGPPGAGKSTYVQQHRHPEDLVVDYDLLGNALGSDTRAQHQELHGTINAARNAVLAQIRKGDTGARHIWIVSTNPKAPAMFPHHEAIHLDPGRDVARDRAVNGGRTAGALDLLDSWYADAPQAMGGPSREW